MNAKGTTLLNEMIVEKNFLYYKHRNTYLMEMNSQNLSAL